MKMWITSLATASKLLNKESFDALVSIGAEGDRLPFGYNTAHSRIRLEFDDVETDIGNWLAPTPNDVQRIIDFAYRISNRDEATGRVHKNILVHCFAGISRSTAAAFIMKCVWSGPGQQHTEVNMRRVIDAAVDEVPDPNRLMVEIADKLLDRGGEMIKVRSEYFDTQHSMY